MDWLAPVISLVVAIAVVVARLIPKSEGETRVVPWASIVGVLVGGGVLALLSRLPGPGAENLKTALLFAAVGMAAGALLAGIEAAGAKSAYDRVAPFAFAAAIMLLFDAKDKTAASAILGVTFGAGLAAMFLFFTDKLTWPNSFTIGVGAIGAANLLGAAAVGGNSAMAGTAIGTILAVAAVMAAGATEILKGRKLIGEVILIAVVLVGTWLASTRYLFLKDTFTISLLALVSAVAVAYLLASDEDRSAFPIALSTLVWVTLATIAFGLLKGYGMAVGLVVGTGTLLALGSARGLLTIGPLFAITIYRLFLEENKDSSRALDIGQHYAIIGVLIGMLVVIGLVEWARSREKPKAMVTTASALAAMVSVGAMLAASVLLGPKGTVGLLIGVGLAPMVIGLRGGQSGAVPAATVGFLAVVALGYGPLGPYLDLERDVKIKVLLWTVGIVLGLAAMVRILGGPMKEARP